MKQIKFRAWHRAHKLMYWWNLLWGNHGHGNGYIGMVLWGEEQTKRVHRDNMRLIDPEDCELMQFTGLLDKNGREIYEGDIVQCSGNSTMYGEVIFERGCFTYINRGESNKDYNNGDLISLFGGEKILGNIFENSELLKD